MNKKKYLVPAKSDCVYLFGIEAQLLHVSSSSSLYSIFDHLGPRSIQQPALQLPKVPTVCSQWTITYTRGRSRTGQSEPTRTALKAHYTAVVQWGLPAVLFILFSITMMKTYHWRVGVNVCVCVCFAGHLESANSPRIHPSDNPIVLHKGNLLNLTCRYAVESTYFCWFHLKCNQTFMMVVYNSS